MGETKVLTWVCEVCDGTNLREVPTQEADLREDIYWNGEENFIFDDQCDHCETNVHEPITRVKAKS